MASINVSYIIARSSGLYLGSACHSKTRAHYLTNPSCSYHGLRSINKVDIVHKGSHARGLLRQSRKRDFNHENSRIIKCRANGGMNLVFVGAEVGPWSKTGGLGDVLGGLPAAMAANGHRVMTVSPRYDQYKDSWDTSVLVEVKVGNKIETVRYFHCYKRGVDRVFVDHPLFLEKVWGKTGGKIYGPKIGIDYQDNQLRFSLLCQAALEAPRVLNLNSSKYFSGPYGEDVVFIANDWHTGVLPCYLKSMYQSNGIYKNAKVAFCIHNMSYQGRYNKPVRGRKINWMKAGILESDRVLTVSPYYAEELASGEDKGVELDSIVRKTGVTGIVNGMDIQEWNPMTDKFIDVKYNSTTVFDAKPIIKESLQAQVGLPVDRNIPVIGFIGRLEAQKGLDILAEAVPKFIGENVQLIALGTGYDKLEQQMEELEVKYPNKARGITKFNVPLAHMMIAGADFMIVPSRFEPCGLIQLQAMRYGTVPIVSSTGGLVDTVKEGYTGFHMGPFNVDRVTLDQEDVNAIATTVKRVIRVYGTPSFKEMVRNCMEEDLSWKGPAKKWEEILLSLSATGVAGSALGIIGEEIAPLALENIAAP